MMNSPIRHPGRLAFLLCAAIGGQAVAQPANTPYDEGLIDSRLERNTPAGQVPAGNWTGGMAAGDPGEQHYITAPKVDTTADRAQAITASFANAYRAAGAPRIAVYFNRSLSAEVREWVPGYQQLTVSSNHSASVSGPGLQTADANYSSERTATLTSRHYTDTSGNRVDPSEAWKWQFEDAVTSVFLEADANIVDRALIFRQSAGNKPNTQGPDGTISVSLNEMSALNAYADILVEVQVTRSASALGYDFRAVGKHIGTGQIIATARLDGEGSEREKRFVATANGYEKQYAISLTVGYISRELTLKLMQSMAPRLKS